MKDPENIELQPLRVDTGWTINWNTFYEVDPVEGMEGFFTGSSLLWLQNARIRKTMDLEWRPEMDLNGHFILYVSSYVEVFNEQTLEFDKEYVEDDTIPTFKTRSRVEVVAKLEELMRILPTTPDPRILKKRGVISEPSESFRLELLENSLSEQLISKILNKGNSKIQNILLDHKDINREIVELFFEKGKNKKVKNKAADKLKSKRFRI